MLIIDGTRYSGSIAQNDEETLVIVVYSSDSFHDVMQTFANVTEITDVLPDETESVYKVTSAVSAKQITRNVFSIEFTKIPTYEMELQAKIDEQSSIIDDLLALILEG